MSGKKTRINDKEIHLRDLKKKYDKEKRSQKPISFNKDTEADLITVADKLNFSVWVKTLLGSFTHAELSLMNKDSVEIIPAVLIERAIENGHFVLDEYLEAKGQKIIDVSQDPAKHQLDYDGINQEYMG